MRSPDIEQLLRVDAGTGPAPPIGDAQADAIVGGALDAVFPVPGGGGAAGGGGLGLKIAAVVAVMAAAGGGAWLYLRDPSLSPSPSTTTSTSTSTTTSTEPEPEPEPEPVAVAEPEPIEMRPETAPKDRPEKVEKIEDLMAEANAARKAKEWKKAEGLYSRVADEFRGTSAAQVALVASATLRLEHLGDARGAVKRFKQAAKGPNAEEARYGLAEAYRAMGDDAKEAEALTEFLRHHGDSPLAERARKRRMQLP